MTSTSTRDLVISGWTGHTPTTILRWWSATVARTAVTERLSVEVVVNRVFGSASSLWSVTIYVKKHEWGDGINHHYSRKDAERTFKTLAGAKNWGSKIGSKIAQIENII